MLIFLHMWFLYQKATWINIHISKVGQLFHFNAICAPNGICNWSWDKWRQRSFQWQRWNVIGCWHVWNMDRSSRGISNADVSASTRPNGGRRWRVRAGLCWWAMVRSTMRRRWRLDRTSRRTANMSKKVSNGALNIILHQDITKDDHWITTKVNKIVKWGIGGHPEAKLF